MSNAGCARVASWVSMLERSWRRTGASKGWKRKIRVGVRGKGKEGGGGGGGGEVGGVRLEDFEGGERGGGDVGGVGGGPLGHILAGDAGEGRVEFDADDFAEVEFAGDEQAAAFAGADVEEGVAVDGVRRDGLAPVGDELAEDAGGDGVVGSDVLV